MTDSQPHKDEGLSISIEAALKQAIAYGFDKGYHNDQKPDHAKANKIRDELKTTIEAYTQQQCLRARRNELSSLIKTLFEEANPIDQCYLAIRHFCDKRLAQLTNNPEEVK